MLVHSDRHENVSVRRDGGSKYRWVWRMKEFFRSYHLLHQINYSVTAKVCYDDYLSFELCTLNLQATARYRSLTMFYVGEGDATYAIANAKQAFYRFKASHAHALDGMWEDFKTTDIDNCIKEIRAALGKDEVVWKADFQIKPVIRQPEKGKYTYSSGIYSVLEVGDAREYSF